VALEITATSSMGEARHRRWAAVSQARTARDGDLDQFGGHDAVVIAVAACRGRCVRSLDLWVAPIHASRLAHRYVLDEYRRIGDDVE
jgi:hypothetical protein